MWGFNYELFFWLGNEYLVMLSDGWVIVFSNMLSFIIVEVFELSEIFYFYVLGSSKDLVMFVCLEFLMWLFVGEIMVLILLYLWKISKIDMGES